MRENHLLTRHPLLLGALLVAGFALLMLRVSLLVGAGDLLHDLRGDDAPIPCELVDEPDLDEDAADAAGDELDDTDLDADAADPAIEGVEESDVSESPCDVAADDDALVGDDDAAPSPARI